MLLKKTKRDTARGLDQVTIYEAKQLVKNDLLIAFHIWLGSIRIPPVFKLNRYLKTLILKGTLDLDKITNWKLITNSSILPRLLNKIIGHRTNIFFETDRHQLRFTHLFMDVA
jgi:hypothetical protein